MRTERVNPLSLISTIVDKRQRDIILDVNPLSLISTIVDSSSAPFLSEGVNPLSLISTIVDIHARTGFQFRQSSFFNFYYCRWQKLRF